MKSIKNIQDISEKPSAIVCIAYHQLSLMCGINNPVNRPPASEDVAEEDAREKFDVLEQLPLIGTILAPFRNGYVQLKESNDVLTTVFSSVEDLFFKGIQYVGPIKETVTNAIESPLQSVDSAICVSRDYLEEKVPGVKVMPAAQIIENIQTYFRNYVIQPMKCIIAAVKDFGLKQIEGDSGRGTNGKNSKGND